jgi:hypothetical protein
MLPARRGWLEEDHEVVLIFDNGPVPPRTNRILDMAFSDAARRVEAACHNHTVGTHSLPDLLHELKRRGYHIVHVLPATPEGPKTATEPSQCGGPTCGPS